ncbi:MAG TPA: Holliday junction resolvase RuvX [Acidimicrobiales bacterium]|nr:Holliday junction resolvase RuvX [Acidimicrobiales bacterium]
MPRAIGLDLGSRRIGVALCDSEGRVATPYQVVERSKDRRSDHRRIRTLYDEVEAELIVVGLPLSLDGSIGPAAAKALVEADELRTGLGVRVETQDERLSTVAAERALLAQHLDAKQRRKVVDKVAAAVILQSWLDSPHEPTRHPSP